MSHYETLGVLPTASKEEIKKAYRQLSMKHHPDRNLGDIEMSKKTQFSINEAYEILGDEEKRKHYDVTLNPNVNINEQCVFSHNIPINEIFSALFGMHHHHHQMPQVHIQTHFFQPIQPIHCHVTVDLSKIVEDIEMNMDVERMVQLDHNGHNEYVLDTIKVIIPQGVEDNECIVIKDMGHVIPPMKGDVVVTVNIRNDTIYQRQGLDLVLEQTITFKESICGFTRDLVHINGKGYKLNNVKGTIMLDGQKRTIPHLGLRRNQQIGNLIIVFRVQPPSTILTDDQLATLQEIF